MATETAQAGERPRLLEPGEISSLRLLIHQTIDACYTGIYPPRAVDFFKQYHSIESIAQRLEQGEVLVVGRPGELEATGSLVGDEISGVFVDPSQQGRGLGRELMAELEARARRAGRDQVTLSVSLPSRSFYLALGYELEPLRHLEVGQGQRLEFWPARKRLVPEPA